MIRREKIDEILKVANVVYTVDIRELFKETITWLMGKGFPSVLDEKFGLETLYTQWGILFWKPEEIGEGVSDYKARVSFRDAKVEINGYSKLTADTEKCLLFLNFSNTDDKQRGH